MKNSTGVIYGSRQFQRPGYNKHHSLLPDKIFHTRLQAYESKIEMNQHIKLNGNIPGVRIGTTGYAAKKDVFKAGNHAGCPIWECWRGDEGNPLKSTAIDIRHALAECGTQPERGMGLLALFLLGMGGGLLALLTPCVFPMIPLTVPCFAKSKTPGSQSDRNRLLYRLYIFLIYIAESVPFMSWGILIPRSLTVFQQASN